MKRLLFLGMILMSIGALAQNVDRVEPPLWWVGMDTPLQLMIHADNIKGSAVRVDNAPKGISVEKIHNADSPNYLFVDVKIAKRALAGDYKFIITTPDKRELTFTYSLKERAEGSASRESFSSKDMIYLLMPDRFANGDKSNDTHKDAVEKGDCTNLGGRHGGDIQGIINHLDYIADLGATAIWSTPMLFDNEKSYSYHGYACADYYKIDPRYGTNELYREYVTKAHDKGIKIIMDMVPNHCGTAHWWMKDLPFKDWIFQFDHYTVSNFALSTQADPYASESDKILCTTGWFDRTMADMNVAQSFVNKYFTQMAIWWVEYAGIDGIRVDTYPYSDKWAMTKWVTNILKEYPKLNIVAECWYGDPLSCSYWEGAKKQYDGFCSNLPTIMDFPLRDALISAFGDNSTIPQWGGGIVKVYNSLSLDYVYANPYNIMIFATNHDTNRLAHDMNHDVSKIKNIMTILATMRGVPQLYYGDEFALSSLDGTTGHSQERIDFPGGWKEDKINLFKPSDRTAEQADLHDHISKLFNWRKGSRAVTEGKLLHFRPTESNVYVYFRYTKHEAVMTVVNNGQDDYMIDWERFSEIMSKFAAKGKNIISGENVKVGRKTYVPAQSSAVIEFK